MNLKNLTLSSLEHNLWVNLKYVEWLNTKSEILLHTEVKSSYSSILKTVHHICCSQEYWRSIVGEQFALDIERLPDMPGRLELFEELIVSSQKLVDLVSESDESLLSEKIAVDSAWFSCNLSRYEYIQQIVLHGAYHRGQIVTMGRHLGMEDAPMTDYNFWNIYKDRFRHVG